MKTIIALLVYAIGGTVFVAHMGQCDIGPGQFSCGFRRVGVAAVWPTIVAYTIIAKSGEQWRI